MARISGKQIVTFDVKRTYNIVYVDADQTGESNHVFAIGLGSVRVADRVSQLTHVVCSIKKHFRIKRSGFKMLEQIFKQNNLITELSVKIRGKSPYGNLYMSK